MECHNFSPGGKMKYTYIFSFITIFAATATICVAANLTGQNAPVLDRPEVISAGGTLGPNIDIDDYLGKVVLVNFWSST